MGEVTKLGWKLEFSQGQEAGQMHKHQEPIDGFCSNHFLSFCSSQKTQSGTGGVIGPTWFTGPHADQGRMGTLVGCLNKAVFDRTVAPPQTNWVLLLGSTSTSAEGKITNMSHLFDDHSIKPSPLFPMCPCIPRQERDQPTQPCGGWMAKGMRWNGALENWAPCPGRLPMCSPSPVV